MKKEHRRLRICQVLLLWMSLWTSPATSQPGFLSIDCGSDTDYVDNTTGITWVSDGAYVSTGKNAPNITTTNAVQPIVNLKQMGSLRYFDDRKKNCYVLPTKAEHTYFFRVVFFYGNWQTERGAGCRFYVYLNNTRLANPIYSSDASTFALNSALYWEVIFYSPGTVLNFCLVRDVGQSFVSSLELRELASGMYSQVVGPAKSVFIDNLQRINCAASTAPNFRYHDDPYDRIWWSYENASSIIEDPSATMNLKTAYPDQPPLVVLQDAWVNYNSNVVSYYYDGIGQLFRQVFTVAYFLEVDGNASATNVRGMTYTLNDKFVTSFNTSNQALEITSPIQNISDTFINMSFFKANWSNLEPILNALEIYAVTDFNESRLADQDLNAISALKTRLNLTDWTGDPCGPVPYDWIDCSRDNINSMLVRVTSLFLENKGIKGRIPQEISNLTALTDVNLQNNFLSGNIPSFGGLQYLTQLHLDNNNLTGGVPANLLSNSRLNFSSSNNPGLPCNGDLPCSLSSKHKSSSSVGVIVGSILGAMALAIIGVILWFVCTKKTRARSSIVKAIGQASERNPSSGKQSINRHALSKSISMMTLQEVSDATKKFSTKIGEGSFGPVYRGRLTNGQEVAIKVKSAESRQGFSEFINEVDMLSRIHHRNLVSLVGYCEEAEQQILIYVFVANGSLRDHLYGEKSKKSLTWQTRLDIAINSARGLQYLHTDCNPRIIHRDVKSANILLDENMGAKVADFGVSKETPEGAFTGVDTVLKGTPGYLDPEYFISQRLTPKSDVYSFGVVLLEIISGCHPHVSVQPDGTSGTLLQRARKSVADENAKNLFDPSMGGNFNHESIMKVISLALRCTDPSTAKRPIMAKVVRELTEAYELELDGRIKWKAYPVTGEISEEKHDTGDIANDFMESRTGSVVANDSSIVLPR